MPDLYHPHHRAIFFAAYDGAVAGMTVSGWIHSDDPATYARSVVIAGTYAQAVDQAFAESLEHGLRIGRSELSIITQLAHTLFAGRAPSPTTHHTFFERENWESNARAVRTIVLTSRSYIEQRVTPPPEPPPPPEPVPVDAADVTLTIDNPAAWNSPPTGNFYMPPAPPTNVSDALNRLRPLRVARARAPGGVTINGNSSSQIQFTVIDGTPIGGYASIGGSYQEAVFGVGFTYDVPAFPPNGLFLTQGLNVFSGFNPGTVVSILVGNLTADPIVMTPFTIYLLIGSVSDIPRG